VHLDFLNLRSIELDRVEAGEVQIVEKKALKARAMLDELPHSFNFCWWEGT
jgi:hypothetical protein